MVPGGSNWLGWVSGPDGSVRFNGCNGPDWPYLFGWYGGGSAGHVGFGRVVDVVGQLNLCSL